MPSLQEYHAACATFCAQMDLVPSAEDTPEALQERRQGMIEGYLMALGDLTFIWESSIVWRLDSPRPDFAAQLQARQDLWAQRLGLLPVAVGRATPESPALPLDLGPGPDNTPRPTESG